MFTMLASYGQKSTLLQNINFRAKELKHSLNESGDSLILSSDKIIYSIEIFNQNFEKRIEVGSKDVKIALNETPLGRLVVQANLIDKRIIMTLLRHEDIEEHSEKTSLTIPKRAVASAINALHLTENKIVCHNYKPKANISFDTRFKIALPKSLKELMPIEDNEAVGGIENSKSIPGEEVEQQTQTRQRTSLTNMLNWRSKKTAENQKSYWVLEETNNGNGSHKTMRLVKEDAVMKMIEKNKLESKTSFGKLNKLTAWEVYDTVNFIKAQVENPNYINSSSSDLFSVVPYYTTANNRLAVN